MGLIFFIRSAPNLCADPSLQEARGAPMKNLGYEKLLFNLPFDHRSLFELKTFVDLRAKKITREDAVAEIMRRYREIADIIENVHIQTRAA
jgi:hypothetical protein